jgi:hypothetical protein
MAEKKRREDDERFQARLARTKARTRRLLDEDLDRASAETDRFVAHALRQLLRSRSTR